MNNSYTMLKRMKEMVIKVSVWFSSTLTGSHLCVFVPLKTVSDDQNDKADDNKRDDRDCIGILMVMIDHCSS